MNVPAPRGLAVAATAALALAAPAAAQLYDPAYRFRTLETDHFRVHFHQGEEALAQEVARTAERAHAVLAPRLGHAPAGRTEVVLSDDTDDANGLTTPYPYNTIRLYAVPPSSSSELNAHRDWLSTLVFHEYVHVLHLDNVGGLPGFLDAIFGRILFPNGFEPGWMVEGIAVHHEADGEPAPGTGRNASALFDMYARALAMEPPGFPRLDQASNVPLDWPLGSVPYLLGGRFMAWIEGRYGQEAMKGFLHDQGSQLWPYAPGWTAERWFGGKDLRTLWAEYGAAERQRFEAQLSWVRGRPLTAPRRLTTRGGIAATPRWSPDGTFIAYAHRSLDERSGVFRVTPDGRDLGRAAIADGNGSLALRSPREAVVAITEVWHEHRLYDDLWRVDLGTGARTRLTDGARASEPALGPDGAQVIYVIHRDGGRVALARRPVGGGQEELLFERAGAEVAAPAVSPDGARIAFELHEGGRRDIALLTLADRQVTRVTDDDAIDLTPAFTPDGGTLLFASDRGGIYNLYAWDAATGGIRQVTNVESGAFAPEVSPDGKTIAFLTYSRAGYDVATLPYDPGGWLEPIAASAAPALAAPAAATADLPSRPYSPWRTLAPRWWLPVWGVDGEGPIWGAMTGGSDVLARHQYAVQGWWSTKARDPGWAAAYVGGWSWPQLDLSTSRFVDSAPGGRGFEADTSAGAGLTLTFMRLASVTSLRLGWLGTWYDVRGTSAHAPASWQLGRADGFLSDLSLGLVYSDARRYVHSVSPEEGRTLALQVLGAAKELGSDYYVQRARGSIAQYLRVPGTRHVVLALRAGGGAANGSIGLHAPFELGGVPQADLTSLLLGTASAQANLLRGYPLNALDGSGYVLGNVELRFPLSAFERGYSTWPIFLRRVHGAVFADLGDAFDLPRQLPFAGHRFDARALRLGAGAELRSELVLGYALVTDIRLGVAHAFGRVFQGQSRDPDGSAVEVYLTVGPSF